MPVISVRDLVKTYTVGEVVVRALRGANMDVEAGEFVAVTGPSGSGKSTLMHILGCLDRPTSGQYFLDGKDVSRMSKDELAAVRTCELADQLRRAGPASAVVTPMIASTMSSSIRLKPRDERLRTINMLHP